MDNLGIIKGCAQANCGYKCCSFGSKGHIVILPHEFDGHEGEISHLEILDEDYFGGKKVRCVAKDCKKCDDGYKPIMCRTYPLWVKSLNQGSVFRSKKCPLPNESLRSHEDYVLNLVRDFSEGKTDVEDFLSKAWVDNYEPMGDYSSIPFKQLTLDDYDEVESLESEIGKDPRMCMKSDAEDVKKCLHSGCSKAVVEDGNIVAYTLAYFTDYGTAYIEKVFVSENWRGRGLQCELVKEAMKVLLSHDVHETYTMASPYNLASLHNFQKVGFRVLRETRCNGYDRMILRRTL